MTRSGRIAHLRSLGLDPSKFEAQTDEEYQTQADAAEELLLRRRAEFPSSLRGPVPRRIRTYRR